MMGAMQKHGRAVAWVLAVALAWTSVPRRADAEVIDRVVAVLDEEAIFLSDLERRARPFLVDIPASAPAEERAARRQAVLREVLERMIDDTLLRQAATRLHVSVTDEDVDQFIERIARERGATVDQMYEALQHEGVSRADYRAHMETEVRRLKVLQQRVRGRISITEADLQEAYRRFLRENAGASVVHAAHIFIAVPDGATEAQVSEARARASTAVQRVRAGETFAAVAASLSDDEASRNAGGDLGDVEPGALPDALEHVLSDLPLDNVSEPVRGPNGFHVLRVTARRSAPQPAFEELRERLYAALLNREMLRQQDLYIRELRRGATVENRLEAPRTPAR